MHTVRSVRKAEPFLDIVRRAVFNSLADGADPLDVWIREVEQCPTTKHKGDHFEKLCVAYLTYPAGGGMAQAWTLSNTPTQIRKALQLPKRDIGIDIVAADFAGKFHAVQAKFKSRSTHRPGPYRRVLQVSWTELSTFYALAQRGPYETHLVMTTAERVSRVAGVRGKDRSVCYQKLKALPREFWLDLAQMEGVRLGENELTKSAPTPAVVPSKTAPSVKPKPAQIPTKRLPTPEELRALRLARFANDKEIVPPSEGDEFDALLSELGL